MLREPTSDNNGVGIRLNNTSTPSASLHVSGTARFTSWTAIAANVTPTTALDVYGTISASNIHSAGIVTATFFEGDGSRLTNLPAVVTDRIVSGTTNVTANNDQSITFTTAGNQRMVIDERGFVGVGTTTPSTALDLSGTMTLRNASAHHKSCITNYVVNTATPAALRDCDGNLLAVNRHYKLNAWIGGTGTRTGAEAFVSSDGTNMTIFQIIRKRCYQ